MKGVGTIFEKIRVWHLLILLVVLYGLLGIYKVIPLRPQSIHQWAQCDRASVAWNYYMGYADFFHPRVNNTDNGTGITGLEFPAVHYFVSILYRIFGFHEWLYRLTTLVVFTLGSIAVFRLSDYFLKDKLQASLLMLLYVCSPLLTFYSCSFVPDIYSLSFAMIAWSLLIRYADMPSAGLWQRWFLAISIACLIKPNSMIHLPVMWMFLYRNDLLTANKLFRLTAYFIATAGLTVAWYAYASWLSKTYQSEVFLLEVRPPRSLQELKDVWEIVSSDWIERIYHPVLLTFILVAGMFLLLITGPFKSKLNSCALLMFCGVAGFLSLMLLQLSYHDYYIITMFPAIVFLLLVIGDSIKLVIRKWGAILFTAFLLISVGFEFYFAKTHLRTSHKKDNWKYGGVYNDKYFDAAEILNTAGITESDQVIIVFDHSPNIALYLLGRRGVSIPYRNLQETLMGYLHTGRYKYILHNTQSRITELNFEPADYPINSVIEHDGIQVFKVSSAFKPKGQGTPLSPWN